MVHSFALYFTFNSIRNIVPIGFNAKYIKNAFEHKKIKNPFVAVRMVVATNNFKLTPI